MPPASIKVAINPTHLVPGKRTPADVNGEAQPMIPMGGTADVISASGPDQRRDVRDRFHASAHGTARMTLEASHKRIARTAGAYAPKKTCVPGIKGQLAPA